MNDVVTTNHYLKQWWLQFFESLSKITLIYQHDQSISYPFRQWRSLRLILVRHKKILHGQKLQRSAKHSIHWCAVCIWLLNPTQWCLLLLSKIIPPNMSALVVLTSASQGEVLWHPRETLPDYCGLSCLWLFPRCVKLNLVVSNGATQWNTQCFKESWNPQPYYVVEILRTLILSNFQLAMTC